MSTVGPITTSFLILVSIWLAAFVLGWLAARHPRTNLTPPKPSPEVSREQVAEIVRSTTRWGWSKVYFAILCLGTMYAVAILLF